MDSTRTLLLLTTAVGLILLSVFLYTAGLNYLRGEVEARLAGALERPVSVNAIDFDVFPLEVRIEETTIADDGSPRGPLADLPEVVVRPDLGSLFGKTWVIEEIRVRNPVVNLTGTGDTKPDLDDDAETISSLPPASGTLDLPVAVQRIRVRRGTLNYRQQSGDTETRLRLKPLDLRAGPVTDSSLRNGIDVRTSAGFGDGRLAFDGTFEVLSRPEAEGTVTIERVKIPALQPLVGPGIDIRGGRVSGRIPFNAHSGGIRADTTTFRVDRAQVNLRESPAVEPETAPLKLAETTPDTSVELSSDTADYPAVTLRTIRLDVLNSTLTVANQSDMPPVVLDRATIIGGPVNGLGDSFPLKAQFALDEPSGHLQLKGRVAPVVSSVGFENFIGRFKVEDVGQLNRFTGSVSPITLKRGELDAAVRGVALDRKLDFAVELYFKGLQSGSITNPNSTILGIPVNLFVKYLKQNDGNLNLAFAVGGTPQAPVLDTTEIRTRILLNLGVDAAVIGTLGVPVYLGNELLQRTSGIDLIGTASSTIGNIFGTSPSSPDPVFDLEEIDTD